MIGKVVYLNYGDVDLDTAVIAIRGKDHWCVIGKDWWTLSEYVFSDMLEANCQVIDLPQLDLLSIVQTVNKTADDLLAALKATICDDVSVSIPRNEISCFGKGN